MGRFQKIISLVAFSVMLLGLSVVASAQYRDQRRNNGYYGNRNIESSIKSLVNQSRRFEDTLDRELDRSRYDGSRREDTLNGLAEKFKNAAENLDDEYDGRRDLNRSRDEASKVFSTAKRLDRALSRSRIGQSSFAVGNAWAAIERNLMTVSNAFGSNYRGTYRRGNTNGRYGNEDRRNRNGRYGNNDRNDRRGTYGNNGRYGNVGSIVSNLKYKARNLESTLDDDRYNRSRSLENLSDRFKNAVDDLSDDYRDRDNGYSEARKVLSLGQQMDREISRSGVTRNVRREWSSIERDLKKLARAYNVSYRSNNGNGRRGISSIIRNWPF